MYVSKNFEYVRLSGLSVREMNLCFFALEDLLFEHVIFIYKYRRAQGVQFVQLQRAISGRK